MTQATTLEGPIESFLISAWWVILLRGVAAIVFGAVTFAWPGISLLSLILLYAAYALLDGMLSIAAAFRTDQTQGWLFILGGAVAIAAAAAALWWPGVTAVLLVIMIGAWAIVRGVFEIITALRLRKNIPNEWALFLSGFLSVLFGVLLVAKPGAGAMALLWLIALWSVAIGALLVVAAFRLRKLRTA